MTLIGLACVGAGFSTIIPTVYSAAGRTLGIPPGPAIAAVTTVGYFGFLASPPLVGLLAELISLRLALGVVVLLGLMIACAAGAVVRSAPPPETVQT